MSVARKAACAPTSGAAKPALGSSMPRSDEAAVDLVDRGPAVLPALHVGDRVALPMACAPLFFFDQVGPKPFSCVVEGNLRLIRGG